MAVDYNYKKGIDNPVWQWLAFFPGGNSNPGTASTYDGKRYIYWIIQTGTTATAASTTQLWRYDTWNNGWQYIATTTSGNQGMDIEYDSVRNVLYLTHGAGLTSWQVFNLNTTAVTVANQSIGAWSLVTITTVLPVAAGVGASLTMPSADSVPAVIDSGTADATGNTTTAVVATAATGTFGPGMVNLQLRVLTGAQAGQRRTISAVTSATTLTVTPALGGALAAGDTFQIEVVEQTASAGTTTTITGPAGSNYTTNAYSFMDVLIVSGTGAGQRRRIASNTATVLTLAAATTGNARTGPFTTAPDATSVFRIVPSDDFLYYQPGGSTTSLYRIDVAQTTGIAWSAALATVPASIAGGGNTLYPSAYAPYQIIALRGNGTGTIYMYNIGTNAWTTPAVFVGSETFNTGASSAMVTGKRRLLVQKEGSTRLYAYDLTTGILDSAGTMPYATGAGYDGKRARVVTTADGAKFLYILRAGGTEFFRVPLEWID